MLIDVDEPTSLSFSSLYLAIFSQPASLSERVTLSMSDGSPMAVSYEFLGKNGEIRYYIAPKIEDE